MSRQLRSWVLTAFMTLALLVGGLSFVPAFAADYQAPPPIANDRCGTNQDHVVIPPLFSHPIRGWGGYYINDQSATEGPHPMGSVDTVTVTASFDSGSWTFSFTNDGACPPQARDGFSAALGVCDPGSGETTAWANVTNTDDASNLARTVYLKAERLQDGWGLGHTLVAANVADGETRSVPLDGAADVGLWPGDYRVRFYYEQYGSPVGAALLTIPSPCGREYAPDYPNANARPAGELKQLWGTTNVRVKAINRRVARRTRFVLTMNPVVGKTVKRTIWVQPRQVYKKAYRGKVGTRFVLKATMANGKLRRVAPVLKVHRR